MDLNILWFILITVLFIGFFVLEGFDYGVGISLPFLGQNDGERRMIINSIGPVWDGNEVWLLTAGGAIFAAFPHWYATMFSGFYMALFLILFALIVRGVAFEFRSKDDNPSWRKLWDWSIFFGSAIPALLWGVAVANLMQGVAIDANKEYVGSFFDLLSLYTIVGGLTTLVMFTLHGAVFITLRVDKGLAVKAQKFALKAGVASVIVVALFAVLTLLNTTLFTKLVATIACVTVLLALIVSNVLMRAGSWGKAFVANTVSILALVVAAFSSMFPNVMISNLNPEWSLTIYNASSSAYTLKVMTFVALTLVPIILLYQGWTYWVFRKRLTPKDLEY